MCVCTYMSVTRQISFYDVWWVFDKQSDERTCLCLVWLQTAARLCCCRCCLGLWLIYNRPEKEPPGGEGGEGFCLPSDVVAFLLSSSVSFSGVRDGWRKCRPAIRFDLLLVVSFLRSCVAACCCCCSMQYGATDWVPVEGVLCCCSCCNISLSLSFSLSLSLFLSSLSLSLYFPISHDPLFLSLLSYHIQSIWSVLWVASTLIDRKKFWIKWF